MQYCFFNLKLFNAYKAVNYYVLFTSFFKTGQLDIITRIPKVQVSRAYKADNTYK